MANVFGAKRLSPSFSPTQKTIYTNKIWSVSLKKISKKTKRGVFAVFWNQISEKSEGGTLLQKKRRGKKREKSEGSPLRRFFRKKSDIIPHLRSFSSVNLRVDSESENRFSVQRIFNEIFLGPDPGHSRVKSWGLHNLKILVQFFLPKIFRFKPEIFLQCIWVDKILSTMSTC